MPSGQLPIACSLAPTDGADRIRRWQQLLASATVDRRPGRVVIRSEDAAELTALAAAERECCGFVTWTVDGDTLTVSGSADAVDAVSSALV